MFSRTFLYLSACLIAASLCVSVVCADDTLGNIAPPPWTTSSAENPAGSYRQTSEGWVDTSHWRIRGDEGKVRFIDHIHPVVWMLLVVALSSGLAVLASDEESVSQIWKESERTKSGLSE